MTAPRLLNSARRGTLEQAGRSPPRIGRSQVGSHPGQATGRAFKGRASLPEGAGIIALGGGSQRDPGVKTDPGGSSTDAATHSPGSPRCRRRRLHPRARTCGPPGASTNSRVLGATSAHLRARGAKVSLWQPGSPGSQSRSSICGHDDGTTHTGAAPSPDRHTQPPSQPPRPARRPTPPRGPASRLALDDGAGGGRCLRPDEAHTFAVSGYVIPGVPGSPGAIPVPPAAVGDARVALRAELVRRG